MPEIVIENLSKTFGHIKALQNVNLTINDGEYLGIIGPSGCGKTTLINCVTGIVIPDQESKIFIDGKDVSQLLIEERNFSMVFQSVTLFPHMSVEKNVEYPGRVLDIDEKENVKRSNRALELVNMLKEKNLYPNELSGGTMQAAAVARAIARETKILILDEPISALDAKVRTELRYKIRRLVKELGLTAIHITHDQEQCLSVSDRVVIMKAGKIYEINSPKMLYEYPNSLFTLNFVGESNFLEGYILSKKNNEVIINFRYGSINLKDSIITDLQVGEAIVLSVRPENVVIGNFREKNSLTGVVTDSRYYGLYYRIEILLETEDIVFADSEYPLPKEKEVKIKFEKNRIQLFKLPDEGLQEVLSLE